MDWSGGRNGCYFGCALCGHKFVPGDVVRWQYTNDIKGAGGNPLLCSKCDTGKEGVIAEIIARRKSIFSDRNWWFHRIGGDPLEWPEDIRKREFPK